MTIMLLQPFKIARIRKYKYILTPTINKKKKLTGSKLLNKENVTECRIIISKLKLFKDLVLT